MEFSLAVKIGLWAVTTCLELVYLPVHLVRLFRSSQKCPPLQNEILLLPAAELAKRIRIKQVTSEAVVKAYINRINEVNPIINAVIENRFEDALQDTKKVDNFIENSGLSEDQIKEKFPLLGVPLTVKGSIAVAGMIHSAGRVDYDVKAKEDAVVVKYVKAVGGIPLLISNVPELCLSWETTNKLIGTTANPYDSSRTPGGSSGGEASLLGCGASVLGLGSDIAGSLRLPAHCCGIWGHKPSPHVVSCVGHYPDCKSREEWNKVFTIGPLARYATDLKLLLNVIAEPEMKLVLRLNEKVDVKKIRVYYFKDPQSKVSNRVTSYVQTAIEKVITHLDIISDFKCKEVQPPLMKYCVELSYARLLNVDGVENVFNGKGDGAYAELLRFLSGRSKYQLTTVGYGLLRRNMANIDTQSMSKIYKCLEELRDDFLHILGEDGVFICPTSPCEATYRGDVYRKLFNGGGLAIFNSLGFPATSCPIALSANGLPIGIQVVAAPNMDRLNLCLAEELERVFGGWNFP